MPKKVLRVFIRKTSQTPDDDYVRIGMPDLFMPKDVKKVHISTIFSWDKEEALILQKNYQQYYPKVIVGGPAFANGSYNPKFIPGRYVKKGITITTRGCNFNCPWCLVPKYEGRFREINIEAGNIIQDNNILLANREHLQKVFQMLRTQKQIRFLGGLDKRLLLDWHIEELRSLKIKELWLSFDSWSSKISFVRVMKRLKKAGFSRNQIRCYVLVGFNEPIQAGEGRLRFVYNCGALPYAQNYQPISGKKRFAGETSREDNLFVRKWSRPAIIKTMNERSNPMERTKELQSFLDNFAKKTFGRSQTETKEKKVCVFCGKEIKMEDFRDQLSIKEYGISGICMKCQDDIFGV